VKVVEVEEGETGSGRTADLFVVMVDVAGGRRALRVTEG
jgi:hypothetical protein